MPMFRKLTIEDGAFALDGGSIFLSLRDMDGVSHALILVQHQIPMLANDSRFPGRLYLNNRMIEVRSDEERSLLSAIKSASISPIHRENESPREQNGPNLVIGDDIAEYLAATQISPEEAITHLRDSLVQFVESEEYVQLANSFKDDNSS